MYDKSALQVSPAYLEIVDAGQKVTLGHRHGHIHFHIRLGPSLPHCVLKVGICKAAGVVQVSVLRAWP